MQDTSATSNLTVLLTSAKQLLYMCLLLGLAAVLTLTVPVNAAAEQAQPLEAIEHALDLEKFSGDWHVVASIPVGIPFFDDSEAFNYTESYKLLKDGRVEMTCAFNDGGFDGERKSFSFKAKSATPSNAEWDVQFVWPFKARYMVIHLDEEYENVIVGVPNRRWAWIMSRIPDISDATYKNLVDVLAANGFDIEKLRRIPHVNVTS